MSNPQTTGKRGLNWALGIGSITALVFGWTVIETKQAQDRDSKNKVALVNCRARYKYASSVPSSDAKCLSLITASDKEASDVKESEAQAKHMEALEKERAEAEAKEREESMAISTAELACRKAVREALTTTDGYSIPLGSVKTARYAGHQGQYVTKFPFSVKNAFGVSMNHAVECVATGTGDIVLVNQLY